MIKASTARKIRRSNSEQIKKNRSLGYVVRHNVESNPVVVAADTSMEVARDETAPVVKRTKKK